MTPINRELQKLYLSWVNDFLTIERFAEHHELTEPDALVLLDIGRRTHDNYVELQKFLDK